MRYSCCDHLRRSAVEGSNRNGIDFLEVLDHDAPSLAERQRTLFVHFINSPAPQLTPDNIVISGGERIRDIEAVSTAPNDTDDRIVAVKVDQPGDFSRYTLSIVQDRLNPEPPAGIDRILATIGFSFKVECPSDFDCKPVCDCEPESDLAPEIDYLAKDYASFRRLVFDRMAVLAPQWRERNPADFGVSLVELLAYAGDYLSYQQDAIGTEAYLGTARRRVSVRRHARLVDYAMHDGCNARAWVQVEVDQDLNHPFPAGTPLCTGLVEQKTLLTDRATLAKADVIFETVAPIPACYLAHNRIDFYAWSDRRCCLPVGARSATLRGHFPDLHERDVLIFEEVIGPRTGNPADADPSHRWAVRLTSANADEPGGAPLTDPLTGDEITEIAWLAEDALPFPVCISAQTDASHGSAFIDQVSVARGNIVLVDHGFTQDLEDLGSVPPVGIVFPPGASCDPGDAVAVPPRYRPTLKYAPLTQRGTPPDNIPASLALFTDPRSALPAITLNTDWKPHIDLLDSDGEQRVFVVEVETDGAAVVRFGDDRHGRRPGPGDAFTTVYRVGNGVAGNVGRDSIKHILSNESAIISVRNPMPAFGGIDPESMEDVRQRAPSAFRTQKRAVTEADYAAVAQRHGGLQRAAATFRWTGSWRTVFLTIDPLGSERVDPKLKQAIADYVEPFRMAGYDLDVDLPRLVSLEIEITVCAKRDYLRSDVKQALLEILSNRRLSGHRLGLFHPDNFTFGQTVYLSPIYAAAQDVPGVDSVDVTIFGRLGSTDKTPLRDGRLPLNRLEIARLDNDPNFPERGVLKITMAGGK